MPTLNWLSRENNLNTSRFPYLCLTNYTIRDVPIFSIFSWICAQQKSKLFNALAQAVNQTVPLNMGFQVSCFRMSTRVVLFGEIDS